TAGPPSGACSPCTRPPLTLPRGDRRSARRGRFGCHRWTGPRPFAPEYTGRSWADDAVDPRPAQVGCFVRIGWRVQRHPMEALGAGSPGVENGRPTAVLVARAADDQRPGTE